MKIFLTAFLIIWFGAASAEPKYPISDHYDGKVFFNPTNHHLSSLWEVLKWKITTDAAEWPLNVANKTYPLPILSAEQSAVVTFVNHASFLIQLKGLNILTDPVFAQRASPLSFMGPKRIREPGIQLENLPKIDLVIISHNHYDHMDLEALKLLDAKFHPLMLVPLGDEKLLKEAGIQNVREMDWWQEQVIREHKIVFAPSQHWSARGPFDKCESLWGSYFILAPNFKIYFGGDTGYGPHFGNIRLRLGAPDLSLLPIGAYAPRYFMKYHHMEPEEAIKAHADLNSGLSIGMHFGTFQLTDEGVDEPVERLKKIGTEGFIVLDQGESKTF